jgi:hypothetical protein
MNPAIWLYIRIAKDFSIDPAFAPGVRVLGCDPSADG